MPHNLRNAELLQEARRVDGEILARHEERNRLVVEIAERLSDMEARGLARALGYESVTAYAARRLGYSASKTRALVAIARGVEDLPTVRAAAAAGEVPWTKLRHVVAVATRESERDWLEKARRLSNRKLEESVAAARGVEVLEVLRLELTPGQVADIDAAVAGLRREEPEISIDAAVAELCRRAVAGEGGVGGSRYRVVVSTCGECGRASREARQGTVPVEASELERVGCDAEVLDVRKGPAAVRRAMPPRIARFIDARDHGRCRVPACANRAFVERHHEGGWRRVGHDPRAAFLLCGAHHRARHEGALHVKLVNGEPSFSLADGTPVVGPGESETGAPEDSREALATAETALRRLGLTAAEARRLLHRSHAATAAPTASPAELLRAALREMPTVSAS